MSSKRKKPPQKTMMLSTGPRERELVPLAVIFINRSKRHLYLSEHCGRKKLCEKCIEKSQVYTLSKYRSKTAKNYL
jgi:hypothetical protein